MRTHEIDAQGSIDTHGTIAESIVMTSVVFLHLKYFSKQCTNIVTLQGANTDIERTIDYLPGKAAGAN